MRHALCPSLLSALAGLLLAACAGNPAPPPTGVLAADARALRYGASAPEVLDNPAMRDKVRGLFGADWNPGAQLTFAAPAFFPVSSPLRMLRIGDRDYIAITGCVTAACATHRGLLLIRQDGEHLMARVDEGGFSHYYDYGPTGSTAVVQRPSIDGAWRAVEDIERG